MPDDDLGGETPQTWNYSWSNVLTVSGDDARTVQTDTDGKNRRNTAAAICNGGGGGGDDDFVFTVSATLSAGLMSAAAFSVRPVALRPAGPTIEILPNEIDYHSAYPRQNSYAKLQIRLNDSKSSSYQTIIDDRFWVTELQSVAIVRGRGAARLAVVPFPRSKGSEHIAPLPIKHDFITKMQIF